MEPAQKANLFTAMLSCPNCNKKFHHKRGKPVFIYCCGDTICHNCWEKCFGEEGFKCPFTCGVQTSMENPQQPKYSATIMRQLEAQVPTEIMCHTHPENDAFWYDAESRSYHCPECRTDTMKPVDKEAAVKPVESVLKLINEQIECLTAQMRELELFQRGGMDEPLLSSQYIKMLDQSKDLLQGKNIEDSLNQLNEVIPFIEGVPSYEKSPLIINNVQFFKNSILPSLGGGAKLERVWKGTKDGFNVELFNKSKHRENPILFIFQSEFGKIFGGYQNAKYSNSSSYSNDAKAFIFSLTNQSIHKPTIYPGYAAYHKDSQIAFGGGHDINIQGDCSSQGSGSYCNFSHSYEPPATLKGNTAELQKYFAGQYNGFKITEMEFYKVTF